MRKIKCLLVGVMLFQLSNNLTAQVIFSEDFSSSTATTPPTGWVNNSITSSQQWSFNNPGGRTLDAPITSPAAIFDSETNGWTFGYDPDVALESPVFSASAITGYLFLSFDHVFVNETPNGFLDGNYSVEVWDGASWSPVLQGDADILNPEHIMLDITNYANNAANAQVRFRWYGNHSYYWMIDNVTVEAVTCPPVVDLIITGITTNSADISWTAGGTESSWNIEWGIHGFIPGTGTGLGSAQSSTETYAINGLNPSSNYDIYVQANCGTDSSYWTIVTGATLCESISTFPWTENFDAMTSLGYDSFPNCWVSENGASWYTDNTNNTISFMTTPYSGDNFLGIMFEGDDYIWTPEFELIAGRTYEFSFMWMGDDFAGWTGEVLVNNTQSSTGATTLTEFVTSSDMTSATYQKEFYCFIPATTGVYSFGLNVYSNYDPMNLGFDDFSLMEHSLTAGTNGTSDVCQSNGLVDLNNIIARDDLNGVWTFSTNPAAIINDSMFDPQSLSAGTVSVNYILSGCLEDTASAVITIYPPSSAGNDGTTTVCKNEPVNLDDELTGTFDTNGDWYDPSYALIPSSQITAPNFPGQYDYKYVTGNEVCPNDTSRIVLTVTNCDWLSVDEHTLESTNLYPNPSNGVVFIESDLGIESLNLVVTDVNGRVIETGNSVITAGTNIVNLSQVQKGIYFLTLSNSNAEKVYRVVIQ